MIFSLKQSLPNVILVLFLIVLFLGIYKTSLRYFEFEDSYAAVEEGFQTLQTVPIKDDGYPFSRLLDSYPATQGNTVKDNSSSDVWFYYPSFAVNSFKQLTNNIKYFKNPDIGTCTATEFCGSFYKDLPKKSQKSNGVSELPPVPVEQGLRVNYYRTPYNLFLSDQPGITCPLPAF
jgi:hypothetical protein